MPREMTEAECDALVLCRNYFRHVEQCNLNGLGVNNRLIETRMELKEKAHAALQRVYGEKL